MRVIITNVFTGHTADLYGDPLSVEEQIRRFFQGGLKRIPHGDLQALLEAAGRMYGFSLSIADSVDYTPPKRHFVKRETATDDPWVREVEHDPLLAAK